MNGPQFTFGENLNYPFNTNIQTKLIPYSNYTTKSNQDKNKCIKKICIIF